MKNIIIALALCICAVTAKAQSGSFYVENITSCNIEITKVYLACAGNCYPNYEFTFTGGFLIAPPGTTPVLCDGTTGTWNMVPPCMNLEPVGYEFKDCDGDPPDDVSTVWEFICNSPNSVLWPCCPGAVVDFVRIPQTVPPGAPDIFVLYVH